MIIVPRVDTHLRDLTVGKDHPLHSWKVCQDYITDIYEERDFIAIHKDGKKTDTGAACSILFPSVPVCMAKKCNAHHSPLLHRVGGSGPGLILDLIEQLIAFEIHHSLRLPWC